MEVHGALERPVALEQTEAMRAFLLDNLGETIGLSVFVEDLEAARVTADASRVWFTTMKTMARPTRLERVTFRSQPKKAEQRASLASRGLRALEHPTSLARSRAQQG